ncbi:hypothetical protein VULLAG_LOCUS5178 [Vulpes lagopus]
MDKIGQEGLRDLQPKCSCLLHDLRAERLASQSLVDWPLSQDGVGGHGEEGLTDPRVPPESTLESAND